MPLSRAQANAPITTKIKLRTVMRKSRNNTRTMRNNNLTAARYEKRNHQATEEAGKADYLALQMTGTARRAVGFRASRSQAKLLAIRSSRPDDPTSNGILAKVSERTCGR